MLCKRFVQKLPLFTPPLKYYFTIRFAKFQGRFQNVTTIFLLKRQSQACVLLINCTIMTRRLCAVCNTKQIRSFGPAQKKYSLPCCKSVLIGLFHFHTICFYMTGCIIIRFLPSAELFRKGTTDPIIIFL